MANNWAPMAPGALGSGWYPTIGSTHPVAEGQPAFFQKLRSTNAKTITALRPAIESDPSVSDPLFTLFEVIAAGNELPAVTTVEYSPNADETIGGWLTQAGGTVNLWARIDDAVVFPPVGSDYIINIGGLTAYRCSVASSGFPLTARVCRLIIRAVVGLDPARTTTIPRKFTFSVYHEPTGQVYQPAGAEFVNNGLAPNPCEVNLGEINPVTNLPWSPADVRSFDAGDWHVRVTSAASASCGAIVTAMSLQVYYVTTENRAAVGTWQRPPGALARVVTTDALVSLSAGAWVNNWTKPASGDFLFGWRRAIGRLFNPSTTVASDIAWLTAYQDLGPLGNPADISYPPPPGMTSDQLTIDANGLPTALFEGDSRRAARLVLRTSAPADDDDSQPYFVRFDTTVLRGLSSAQPVGQLITPPNTLSYLGVKLVVIPPDTDTSTLTVRVYNATTGVQIGTGSFTITAAAARALPVVPGTTFRYVEGFLSASAALTASTQVEVRCTTDTTDVWTVSLPNTDGNGSSSFGGTTDAARLNGLSGPTLTGQDMMLQLLVQPSAPTNPRTVVRQVPRSGGGTLCTPEAIDQVTFSWTATTLAGSWLRYEIERLDQDVPEWTPVAVVTSAESLVHWTDHEPARDRSTKYRVRVVATTTAVSEWATGDWVRPASYGAEMIFTTNQEPGLEVAVDYEPSKDTDFPDHDRDVLVALYGTDGVVAFMEPEDRGLVLGVRLIVSAEVAPCDDYGDPLPDNQVWQPLRDISRANLPYVCVLDAKGNRTYAHVQIGRGLSVYDANGRLAFYWCQATITTTSGPTVVEL